MEAQQEIKTRNMKSKIFGLVHDSVLAEVPNEEIDEYNELLLRCIQKDRGLSIKDCPIGCDFEIGEDYSMGKFVSKYASIA